MNNKIKNQSTEPFQFKIAYFDFDKVKENCREFKKLDLEIKNEDLANQNLCEKHRQQLFEKITAFEKGRHKLAQHDLNKLKNDILVLEKELHKVVQIRNNNISVQNLKIKHKIKSAIQEYLKIYNKNKNYNLIIDSDADFILYKDASFDITDDIITGINNLNNHH
ncbi:MAG: OmpH family outer membrane protein [Alphaproteobacteria bacterium]|nr:OmpH family outer membrane protein [Alphaproteobacteria bacterium]